MSRIKYTSVTRSNTKQELPTISLKTPRVIANHSKSYLREISKQFSGDIEYDDMQNHKITKQQFKLNQILRKMNDDTVKIISNYTPKTMRNQHHRTATTILAINQQQVQNNHKIMSQCEVEIVKLKQRADGLNFATKQLYIEQIGNLEQAVSNMRQQTKLLRNQNDKRGKIIIEENRVMEEGDIRKLETDVFLVEHRASHLRADDARVTQDMHEYELKLKNIHDKWVQSQKYFKNLLTKNKEQANLKNCEVQFEHSKAVLENIRKKSQFYNQNCQYKYLSLLRKLDNTTNQSKDIQNKIDKNFATIEASKMIISRLQNQLFTLKAKKKQKQEHINQFLSKTKADNNSKFMAPTENIRLPSDIDIKNYQNDISQHDIQQAIARIAAIKSQVSDSREGLEERGSFLHNQEIIN